MSSLVRCENGHFYDSEKYASCPHCSSGGDGKKTQPFSELGEAMTEPVTMPLKQAAARPETGNMSLRTALNRAMTSPVRDFEEEKTISIYQTRGGVEPVTGWLVCIEGVDFGRSFTLKSGKNFVGRAAGMDVELHGDNSVSREKHAILLYEPRRREFIAQAGESRELFYLNDEVVLNPVRMKQHDILTIGNTRLMFFPCCSDHFSWDDYKKDETDPC